MSDSRKHGLVQIGELLPGFKHLRPASQPQETKAITLQSKHHFTRIKQINALVGIADDPATDMGFMARMMTLCSLPRTDPGTRLQYKRQNGPYKLVMIAGGDNKLPYGNLPRLLLAWVSTEAVRTQERELILGSSLSSFMRQLGMYSTSGGKNSDRTRLRHQIDRLFNAHVQLIYETPGHKATASSAVADRTELWWDYKKPDQQTLWQSRIHLGEAFFNEIIAHPVPLDMRILKQMRRSSLGLDLYMWLSYKTFALYSQKKRPERLSWRRLYVQFGSDPELASDKITVQNFRKDALRELHKLRACWPALNYATPTGCLEIRGCPPSVSPQTIAR
jgi:Plasmid encoded RepA protein